MSNVNTTALDLTAVKNKFSSYDYQPDVALQKGIEATLPTLAKKVTDVRNNKGIEQGGLVSRKSEYTLEEAVKSMYGAGIGDFYHALGFNPQTQSLGAFAKKFASLSTLNFEVLGTILQSSQNFSGVGGTNSTAGIASEHAWLISELIRRPIIVNYNKSVNYPNWVAATIAVSKQRGQIPIINTNDLIADEKNTAKTTKAENTVVRRSFLELKTKPYEVLKRQISVEITDELLNDYEFDLLAITSREGMRNLAAQSDGLFINRAFYGDVKEGANYPEKPPFYGIATANTLIGEDIDTLLREMRLLNYNVNKAILSSSASIKNLGGTAERKLFREIYPNIQTTDIPLPAKHSLYFDSNYAMGNLSYKPMELETQREAETGKTLLVMRAYVGFVVMAKNAIAWQKEDTTTSTGVPTASALYSNITDTFMNQS